MWAMGIRDRPVSDQVAWRIVPAAGLGQLTDKPFRIGMGCHTQPQKLAAERPQDEKSIRLRHRVDRHVRGAPEVGGAARLAHGVGLTGVAIDHSFSRSL
jgi:hypothetical protein